MTPEERKHLAELAEAATDGPWRVVGRDFVLEDFPQVEMNTDDGHYFTVHGPEDADFIAAAREAVPALLADIAAVEAERDLAHARNLQLEERLRFLAQWLAYCRRLVNPGPAIDKGVEIIRKALIGNMEVPRD